MMAQHWIKEIEAKALQRFETWEWPAPKEEEWRRTNLERQGFFSLLGEEVPRGGEKTFPGLNSPPGVTLTALERLEGREQEEVRIKLEERLLSPEDRFEIWNLADLSGGIYLSIPENWTSREPIEIVLKPGALNFLYSPFVFIEARGQSRADVVIRYEDSGSTSIYNTLVIVETGEGAHLNLWTCQELGEDVFFFNHTLVNLERDVTFRNFDALLGGKVTKSKILTDMKGPGSNAELKGIYFTTGKGHTDIVSVQRHHAPNATSRSYYKGVVRDRARSVYQGLIEVKEGARETDAYLTNKNLILNDGARSDSIPKLKIDNNDVRCSHGSTSGRIEPEQLFYLTSRGVPREEARQLIIEGYLEEVFQEAPGAFAEDLKKRIAEKAQIGE